MSVSLILACLWVLAATIVAMLEELNRGVTLLKGTGMFSGRDHGILMCVVSRRQVSRLKEIVYDKDPKAFVVVTGADDVRGEGFRPLEA